MWFLSKWENVNQFQVMSYLVPGCQLKGGFRSPFRPDKNPGCWLSEYNGNLYYHDPKDYIRTGKNIVGLWCLEFGVDEQVAVKAIKQGYSNLVPRPVTNTKPEPKPIKYELRNWEVEDEEYWMQFGLTSKDLEKGTPGLFPCLYVEYYSRRFLTYVRKYSTDKARLYVYVWDDAVKLYCPEPKTFLGNAGEKHDYFYEGFGKNEDTLVICSGGKDAKVVNKEGFSTYAKNGEMYSPSSYNLGLIKSYPNIIIGLDSDDTGIMFANKLKEYFKTQDLSTNIILPRYKDWALDVQTGFRCEDTLLFQGT